MARLLSLQRRGFMRCVCVVIFSIALTSCVFDHRSVKIDGPYVLVWIDTPYTTEISFDLGEGASVGRVPARVTAYGFNEKYITAYREQVGYYYIDRANDHQYAEPADVVFGPYDDDHFKTLETQLGLPSLRDVARGF